MIWGKGLFPQALLLTQRAFCLLAPHYLSADKAGSWMGSNTFAQASPWSMALEETPGQAAR